MLTKVTANGPPVADLVLPLTAEGRTEATEVLQLRNIDGLGPVKASVNTSPFGNVSGVALTGTNVADRNIVLTLGPQPDYRDWSVQKLRNKVYEYFMPELEVNLVFESDDMPTVEIAGVVESCEPAIFSKDNEILVSIICPQPYFSAIAAKSISGHNEGLAVPIDYEGTADTSVVLTVTQQPSTGDFAKSIYLNMGDGTFFHVQTGIDLVNATFHFQMNSAPGLKFAETTDGGAIVTHVLYGIQPGSVWPMLKAKRNYLISLTTDAVGDLAGGSQNYTLSYIPRYGGL